MTSEPELPASPFPSQEIYHSLFEQAGDAIFVADSTGRYVEVNPRACQMLGYSRAELLQLTIAELVNPIDLLTKPIRFDELRVGKVITAERELLKKDGEPIPVEITGRMVAGGYFLGIVRDISERKKHEKLTRDNEELYRQLFELGADPMIMVEDFSDRILAANQSVENLYGFSRAELLAMCESDLQSDETDGTAPTYRTPLVRGGVVYIPLRHHRKKDGATFPVEISARYFVFQGRSVHIMVLRDISEREHNQRENRAHDEKYRTMLQATLDGFLLANRNGALLDANSSYCQMVGYTRADLLDMNFGDLEKTENPEKVCVRLERAIQKGADHFESQHRHKNGTLVDLDISVSYIELDGGLFILFLRDITAKKQAEAAHRAAEEALHQSRQMYYDLVETAQDLIWQVDGDGTFTYLNPAWQTVLGYPLEAMLGRPFTDFQPPEQSPLDLEQLTLLMAGEPVRGHQTIFLSSDENVVFLVFNAKPLHNARGKIVGASGTAYDITERLREANMMSARFRLVQRSLDDTLEDLLTATLDEAEKLTGSTIGFYHFLEADERTILLQAWSTNTLQFMCKAEGAGLHYDVDLAGVWADAIRLRKPVIHNDYAALTDKKGMPDGHAQVLRELSLPVFRGDKIVAILGVGNKLRPYDEGDLHMVARLADLAWDIVERKRSEKSQRESEEKYRRLVELSPDLIAIHSQGRVRFINPAGLTLLGASQPGQVLECPVGDFLLSEGILAEAQRMQDFYENPLTPLVYEQKLRCLDGSLLDAEVAAAAFSYQNQPAVLVILHDITRRKQAEREIKTALAEKETLLRELYHRTKNNMQVIISLLELESNRVQSEVLRGAFQDMQTRIQSMALVHQMLYRSRNLSSIDLKEYVSDLIHLLTQTYDLESENITFHLDAESVNVLIDVAIPCGLIINELISNAIKHAFPGRRAGDVFVKVGTTAAQEILLEVADNGVGAPSGFDFHAAETLGLHTLIALAERQLHGKITFINNGGVTCRVEFSDSLYQPRV